MSAVDRSDGLLEKDADDVAGEQLSGESPGPVPGSIDLGREPGTAAVPGSETGRGTKDRGNCAPVPGSAHRSTEPGTEDETPLYVDISALLDGTVPEPPEPQLGRRTDGHALFYPGQVNWVFGDPESGKSWLCLVCVTEALSAGRRVLMIDLDHNGALSTIHRLLALGARPDALRNRNLFRYCEPEDAAEVRQVVEDSRTWRPAVAVVDSIGELLPMCGANTNSADEFTVMHTKVLKPLAKAGAAVLAVDHLAKNADSRAVGPGGTAAKRRAIGGSSIRVKVKQPFTPGHGGSATLIVNKDRHGGLRAHCPVGDREPVAGTFKLLVFDEGALAWVIDAPGSSPGAWCTTPVV
ncbi:AAA family ATPase [Mycobacterium sp. SMC-8]|uniref:AAA family ATPase n=1 Tax=Mycobacterium sp. SMC-8 TaxID=2857060 RepID=UPI0021B2ECD0|nr:AAA family ATPase [Mycobacterium sp. SMC-8]